jgi:hypothetical protein
MWGSAWHHGYLCGAVLGFYSRPDDGITTRALYAMMAQSFITHQSFYTVLL